MALANDFDAGLAWERLNEILDIEPWSGLMFWKNVSSRRAKALNGKEAGTLNCHGYVQIGIDGRNYRRSRLMWFYVHRVWPKEEVDHENLKKDDDRIANLREATYSQNMYNRPCPKNNSTGHKGVDWRPKKSRFRARITAEGKTITVGHFLTLRDAIVARETAQLKHHGEFARAA